MKKSIALEKLLKELATESLTKETYKKELKKATSKGKKKSYDAYIKMEKRLHDDDIRKAVKACDWKYIVDEIEGFLSDTDSGKWGKIFEIIVKLYLIGYRGNSCIISPKGNVDVIFSGRPIEIKSNCGYLDDMRKSALVVYTMDNKAMVYTPEQATVFMSGDFWMMLEELGLMRLRADRNGIVKPAIQSYKNSKKKMFALEARLAKEAGLKEFKESVKIK